MLRHKLGPSGKKGKKGKKRGGGGGKKKKKILLKIIPNEKKYTGVIKSKPYYLN